MQAVSSRPDFVPPSYSRELEKLQDKIPPYSDEEAMRILQEELGQPVNSVFSEFSRSSIAAASLGQVSLYSLQAVSKNFTCLMNLCWTARMCYILSRSSCLPADYKALHLHLNEQDASDPLIRVCFAVTPSDIATRTLTQFILGCHRSTKLGSEPLERQLLSKCKGLQ